MEVPAVSQQKDWLISIGESLRQLEQKRNKAMLDQCEILYEVHNVWNNVDMGVQGFWDYDYFKWASSYTQNEHVSVPDKSTIRNKIYVWRDFMSDEAVIEVPKKVKVLKRNEAGKPLGDGSASYHWEEIETDLRNISYTKLVYIRKTALEEKMTDELWGLVFDNRQTVAKLQAKLQGLEVGSAAYLTENEGIVSVKKEGEERVLAVIYFEDEDDLWKEGIEQLLKGVKRTTLDLV